MRSDRAIAVLAGGVGAARFLRGLLAVTARDESRATVTVIGNTGDDIRLFGLQICPDLDSVMYGIAGQADPQRGWGRAEETFRVLAELRSYQVQPDWFGLGDLDLATHLARTQLLDSGYTLSQVTATLCSRWDLAARLIPMTDDRVETHVLVQNSAADGPQSMHFQEWWVRHRAQLPARDFRFRGVDEAGPAPGVLEAIAQADLIVLPPSNPVVSLGPILAVPGIREAVVNAAAPVVGVSPIIGTAPVHGMADACLRALGVDVSAHGVAGLLGARQSGGVLDYWLVDTQDADQTAAIRQFGIECIATGTLMTDPEAGRTLASAVLRAGGAS